MIDLAEPDDNTHLSHCPCQAQPMQCPHSYFMQVFQNVIISNAFMIFVKAKNLVRRSHQGHIHTKSPKSTTYFMNLIKLY